MQPDSEQAAVVVGVRGTALREAEIGVALSLCLLLVLAASHPNWKGMGIYTALAAAVYTGARAASKFRSRLDDAVSLPTEAVETLGWPKRPPLGRKWAWLSGRYSSLRSEPSSPLASRRGGSAATAGRASFGRSCEPRKAKRRSTSPTGRCRRHSGGRTPPYNRRG